MHVRRSALFTMTALLALTAPVAMRADDASHRAKAEEMLQVTKATSAMKQALANLQASVEDLAKQQLGGAPLSAKQQTLADDYLKQVHGIVTDEVNWDKIYPQIVNNYAQTFTDAELDSIIAFYKTPAGTALLEKTPQAESKTSAVVSERVKEMQPKLQAVTVKFADDLRAASAPAGAASPAATAPATKSTPAHSGKAAPAR